MSTVQVTNTPRRLAGLLALIASLSFGPATAPALAATDDAPHLGRVTGHATTTPEGTSVSYSFSLSNSTGKRTDARRAYVSLVAVDREVGPSRSYRIDTVRVPALRSGSGTGVTTDVTPPRPTTSGDYHVRVCFTARAGNGECRISRNASVHIDDAALTVDPEAVEMADTAAGEVSSPVEVVISNAGASRTNNVALALTGVDAADFAVAPGSCTTWLAPGESCTAEVTFAPAGDSTGSSEAALRVAGRGRGGVVTVPVTGTVPALSDITIEPPTYSYGQVPVGTSVSATFQLTNHGDTDQPLENGQLVPFDSAFAFDYAEGQNSCLQMTVPAHGHCTFSVAFTPQAAGTFDTLAQFTAGGMTGTSAISGTGVEVGPSRPSVRAPRATSYGR